MKTSKGTVIVVALAAIAAMAFVAGKGGEAQGAGASPRLSPQEQALLSSLGAEERGAVAQAYAAAKAEGKDVKLADLMPETVYAVKAAEAGIATLASYIDSSGDLVSETSVEACPDIGGRVASVAVEVGDRVQKGQAIAVVDPSTPGSSYAMSAVSAPISGTVTAVSVRAGAKVSSSTAIATVGLLSGVRIKALIRERDVAEVKVGQRVVARLEAYPGEAFEARVARLSPVLDASSRTRTAWIELEREDGRAAPGMYARVRIYTRAHEGVVAVPEQAVFERYGKAYAYAVARKGEADRAELRELSVGATVDGKVEIKAGLAAGERVVTAGRAALGDGALVRVVSVEGAAK